MTLKKRYKTTRKYSCPFCDKKMTRDKLVAHVEKDHEIMIPENYSATRVVYDNINGKNYGTCMVCKSKVYEWDDRISRYKNLCSNPRCLEQVKSKAKQNRLDDPEIQKKMLAGRKLHGTYRFSDGTEHEFMGSYEKNTLEFMDKVLNIPGKDIITPGPTIEYMYNGEKHYWILDIWYVPAMLVIDVKDGGDNPNTRPMESYREKQLAKEEAIAKTSEYNYLRLTDNNFGQLMSAIADIRYGSIVKDPAKGIYIHELSGPSMGGVMPPWGGTAAKHTPYVVPYMLKNTFSDDDEEDETVIHEAGEVTGKWTGKRILHATFKEVQEMMDRFPKEDRKYMYTKNFEKEYSPVTAFLATEYTTVDGDKYGGYINIFAFDDDPEYGIVDIGVEPGARGKGLADKLIKRATRECPRIGINHLIWKCDKENTHSADLAKRNGFKPYKVKESEGQFIFQYDMKPVKEESTIIREEAKEVTGKWTGKRIMHATFKEIQEMQDRFPKSEYKYIHSDDTEKEYKDISVFLATEYTTVEGKKYGGYINVFAFDDDPEYGIVVIGVEPGARGKGIADKLIRRAVRELPSIGINHLIWKCDKDNAHSVELAKRNGFKPYKVKEHKGQLIYQYDMKPVKEESAIFTEAISLKDIFKKKPEIEVPDVPIVKANLREAYTRKYLCMMRTVSKNQDIMEEVERVTKNLTRNILKIEGSKPPTKYAYATVEEFYKEYNFPKDNNSDKDNLYIFFPTDFGNRDTVEYVAGARDIFYYNDYVNTCTVIVKYKDKSYKPKSYVDTREEEKRAKETYLAGRMESASILTEAISLKDIFKKKEEKPIEVPNVPLSKANFKEAYDHWYFTLYFKVDSMDELEDACRLNTEDCISMIGKAPTKYMYTSCEDFNKEYNIPKEHQFYDEPGTYFVMFSYNFIPEKYIPAAKDALDARYFTDVVDNQVRVVMNNKKNYKPKSYIDMDNIAAANKHLGITESTGYKSTVYFTRKITPESLCKIASKLYHGDSTRSMIKINSGEPGGHNYLKPELIKDLVDLTHGVICDTNTAYEGKRQDTETHLKTMKDHGFTDIAEVDILDSEGELEFTLTDKHLCVDKVYAGSHITNYDKYILLSHFKGHAMAGFGGAMKNVAIGLSSARGKSIVHSGGKAETGFEGDQTEFLKSMADAVMAFSTFMGKDAIYINIANNISVDCDCDANARPPAMKDIGIFASMDPLAVDQACIDAVYRANDSREVIDRIESKNGRDLLKYASEMGVGNREYNLVDIDAHSDVDGFAFGYDELDSVFYFDKDGKIVKNDDAIEFFKDKNGVKILIKGNKTLKGKTEGEVLENLLGHPYTSYKDFIFNENCIVYNEEYSHYSLRGLQYRVMKEAGVLLEAVITIKGRVSIVQDEEGYFYLTTPDDYLLVSDKYDNIESIPDETIKLFNDLYEANSTQLYKNNPEGLGRRVDNELKEF